MKGEVTIIPAMSATFIYVKNASATLVKINDPPLGINSFMRGAARMLKIESAKA
jgi:hypothetical protein